MSHPTLGYDPAPGDPTAVRQVAAALAAVAGDAESITNRLQRIGPGAGDTVWRGPAADAFHSLLAGVGPDVVRLASAHREAQDALVHYAADLERAQDIGRRAESDAAGATGERDRAAQLRRQAAGEAADRDREAWACRARIAESQAQRLLWVADPGYQAELQRYETQIRGRQQQAETQAAQARGREQSARTTESAAGAALAAARILGEQATQVRDGAAGRTVARLEAAGPAGARGNALTRFLGQVDDTLKLITADPEFARWMQRISDVGGVLLNIGSLVSLLPIPGAQAVGGALLIGGFVLKGVSLAGTVMAAVHGNASAGDVLYRGVDLALAAFTARAGGEGAKAVKRALDYRAAGPTAAGQLSNLEEKVARGLHISAKRYFQTGTALSVGGTLASSGTGAREAIDRALSPHPRRPDAKELVMPIVTTGAGKAAEALRINVVVGAATGGAEIRGAAVEAVR